jgi:hypothetical protein
MQNKILEKSRYARVLMVVKGHNSNNSECETVSKYIKCNEKCINGNGQKF